MGKSVRKVNKPQPLVPTALSVTTVLWPASWPHPIAALSLELEPSQEPPANSSNRSTDQNKIGGCPTASWNNSQRVCNSYDETL